MRSFLLVVSAWAASMAAVAQEWPLFEVREGLDNCRLKFTSEKQGRVAFLGGSITTAGGWRVTTGEMLQKRFPDTTFDFINAGIGGTNSTLGAFRFSQDVFGNGPVDLLFVEFAVNDGDEESADNRSTRALEGIIRQARRMNPKIDIVVQYLTDQGKVEMLNNKVAPPVIARHDAVAQHYNLPVVFQAMDITRRLAAGEFAWEGFSRDSCHPNEFGHGLYTENIGRLLDAAWAEPVAEGAAMVDRPLPAPLDPHNYEKGRFIALDEAQVVSGWVREPTWQAEKTCNYSGPVDVLAATSPGDTFTLTFEGSLIGINAIAGMDAGTLAYSVDGGAELVLDMFDQYCPSFHRPVCRVLAEDLTPGQHTLTLRISDARHEKSEGTAARILRFVAN